MLRRLFGFLFGRRSRAAVPQQWQARSEALIDRLRAQGVTIGEQCVLFTDQFSLEPYLVEIGNRVAVAGGTMYLTHDGAALFLRRSRPDAQHFGRIGRVGHHPRQCGGEGQSRDGRGTNQPASGTHEHEPRHARHVFPAAG